MFSRPYGLYEFDRKHRVEEGAGLAYLSPMTETLPEHRLNEARWRAVVARDRGKDGSFVYAVESTGIYCRPSCPSRRPHRDRVSFFDAPTAALSAGFRACKRCKPDTIGVTDPKTRLALKVCRLIDAAETIPSLETLGVKMNMSPFHLQRSFKEAMGITPRQYGEARRLGRLKEALGAGEAVAGALYGAGYGSASRLYEKAKDHLGMTPASYARGGKGALIAYSIVDSPLGRILAASTAKGVCAVYLSDDDKELVSELQSDFPEAEITKDDGGLAARVAKALTKLDGREPSLELPLDLQATAFQWQVWQELCRIPAGETRSYGEIAQALGKSGAARAVGRACATNPVSLIIPCHRAIGSSGSLTGYRWGKERKKALLDRERKNRG
jgi:AraC family transcriptional regulator of adaptative response/methylated-DNA-[protein]-cysteine methyltransferase